MTYNFDNNYQYDSCSSRGLCSINPRISSLQEVLILYLKATAYYVLQLRKLNIESEKARNIIINTISVMISNTEFSEKDYKALTNGFNIILQELFNTYQSKKNTQDFLPQKIKHIIKLNKNGNIINSIKFGEKEFIKRTKKIPDEIRDLFQILFILTKSICVNILDLGSLGKDSEEGYSTILKILNSLNTVEINKEKLITTIKNAAINNDKLSNKLQDALKERYGEPTVAEVPYSTVPSKAILVVGSNIKELEDILEATKNEDIDIYTHGEMINAYNYPKFREYKHLKGQFGRGIENCQLDFATFPGPIILTRHSLHNVEHFYRGLLYTTDPATLKGVIQIKNKDFSKVIKSAKESRGFKTGQIHESVEQGFNFNDVINKIRENKDKYSHIFIIGLGIYNLEEKFYFEKLLTKTPINVLLISLSFCFERKNVICLNSSYNYYAITKLAKELNKENIPITIFFPNCDKHTISQIINLIQLKNITVYLGKCIPTILNPNMLQTFTKIFDVKNITNVKNNLNEILNR